MNPQDKLAITINGESQELDVPVNRTLIDLIKDDLGLIGTKDGCRQGVCGACTVLVDGIPIRSCLELAVRCHGKAVTTIEGLRDVENLHPLQQAFIDIQAVQCGACYNGMTVKGAELLSKNLKPTEAEIRTAMNGHLCRCGTYPSILKAIQLASAKMSEPGQ